MRLEMAALSVFLAISAPSAFSADVREKMPTVRLNIGASFYPAGFDTLSCSSLSRDMGTCRDALSFSAFPRGLLALHPPITGLRRLGVFVRWENYSLASPGLSREIGVEIRFPKGFTAGISQHRFYTRAKKPESIDGPGGGLWVSVFLEKFFEGKENSVFRKGVAGILVFPPHNEFDLKACSPGVGFNPRNKCNGFARYKLYGGASLYPLRKHPRFFVSSGGYVFLGSNAPQVLYTWSPRPISGGGKVGFGFDLSRYATVGFYQNFYLPFGRYARKTLPGAYSQSGPYGGNAAEISIMFHFDYSRRKK